MAIEATEKGRLTKKVEMSRPSPSPTSAVPFAQASQTDKSFNKICMGHVLLVLINTTGPFFGELLVSYCKIKRHCV